MRCNSILWNYVDCFIHSSFIATCHDTIQSRIYDRICLFGVRDTNKIGDTKRQKFEIKMRIIGAPKHIHFVTKFQLQIDQRIFQ